VFFYSIGKYNRLPIKKTINNFINDFFNITNKIKTKISLSVFLYSLSQGGYKHFTAAKRKIEE
jgi:hypothetical protein